MLNKRLVHSDFCRDRFCPLCAFRRSKRLTFELYKIIDEACSQYSNSCFIFATFTVKNCKLDELRATVNAINKGFSRLNNYVCIAGKRNILMCDRIFKGSLRSIEITYNADTSTFHPHLHVLFMVDHSYFDKDQDNYISQKKWG